MTLVAKKDLKPRHTKELISAIQKNPSNFKYAHAGRASASHLCGMLLQNWMKTRFNEVVFNGTGPAMDALVNGQVDVMCDQTTNTTPQIAANTVKAYAVTTAQRVNTPELKKLPTLQEAGFAGLDLSIWHGLYAPIGIPEQAARVLNEALVKTLKDPEFMAQQAALGAVVASGDKTTPEGHGQFVNSETVNWTFVINRADRAMRSGQ